MKNRTKILVTIALLQFALMIAAIAPAKAQLPNLEVLPATVEIPNVGDTATVDVNITGVQNLYAYEVKIWFLLSKVNTTEADVVRPAGHILEPADSGNFFEASWTVDYNATYPGSTNGTYGLIWCSVTLFAPEDSRNGTGILFRITFTGVSEGTTPIIFFSPTEPYPAILADNLGGSMAHTATDGSLTVIPEFPIFLLLPVLALTSVVIASFAKLYRRKQFN